MLAFTLLPSSLAHTIPQALAPKYRFNLTHRSKLSSRSQSHKFSELLPGLFWNAESAPPKSEPMHCVGRGRLTQKHPHNSSLEMLVTHTESWPPFLSLLCSTRQTSVLKLQRYVSLLQFASASYTGGRCKLFSPAWKVGCWLQSREGHQMKPTVVMRHWGDGLPTLWHQQSSVSFFTGSLWRVSAKWKQIKAQIWNSLCLGHTVHSPFTQT